MIYTLTPNPSLDYILKLPKLKVGETNRAVESMIVAGGKGINVSLMLQKLGIASKIVGFLAGFSGEEIKRQLQNQGLDCDFVFLTKGQTRINVKMHTQSEESEINTNGAKVEEKEKKELFAKINQLKNGDVLILAGSLPNGVDANFYAEILCQIKHKQILSVVDTYGEALKMALSYKPFLIKPNLRELEELFKTCISRDEIVLYAKELQQMGAKNVLVSLGKDGAVMVREDGVIRVKDAPKGELKNSVGAGDSMVAGFVAGVLEGGNLDAAFDIALACGSASAFSQDFASKEEVLSILKTLKES